MPMDTEDHFAKNDEPNDEPNENAPEQSVADLVRLYMGSNVKSYERHIHSFLESEPRKMSVGWIWVALVFPYAWLMYRKMWGLTAVFFVFNILNRRFIAGFTNDLTGISSTVAGLDIYIVSFIFGSILTLFTPILGQHLYVRFAKNKVQKIVSSTENMDDARTTISQSGGVSKIGAVIGSLPFAISWSLLASAYFMSF